MRAVSRILLLCVCVCVCACPAPFIQAAGQNTGEVELTREGKASVQMAQQFLAARQRADGSFSGEKAGTGIVAVACLSWMVSGNLPGEGPYGKNVAKGIDYILSSAQPRGLLFKGQDAHVMYHHGLATLCLAEAWGQTRDKRIYDKLKNAVKLIVDTQNNKGGWRYQPKVEGDDLSVTVMQVLALRAAKDAGIAVPSESIQRALDYVDLCRTERDKDGLIGYAYTPRDKRTWSTTAAGAMSLLLCGRFKEKASDIKDSLAYLKKVRESKEDKDWFIYGHYYAAMAMYRAGGESEALRGFWMQWYPDIAKSLIQKQKTSGADRGKYDFDKSYGVWGTAMCSLIMGIPYRYLPIYQR